MKDFLDQLDERLRLMAHDQQQEVAPAAAPAQKRSRKRPALLGGATAVLAALATVFTMSGTSLAELPILKTPTTDASGLRRVLSAADRAGVDFSKAHTFGTPGGPGYVLASDQFDELCIAVPDPGTPGEYGQQCTGPLAKVGRDGLATLLLGQGTGATNTFAFVLPDGAEDVRLSVGGRSVRPQIESGVLVARISAAAVVTWTVDGTQDRHDFAGPLGRLGAMTDCRNGGSVPVPPGADQATIQKLRKTCR
jgi:hypothetical protein